MLQLFLGRNQEREEREAEEFPNVVANKVCQNGSVPFIFNRTGQLSQKLTQAHKLALNSEQAGHNPCLNRRYVHARELLKALP